MHPKYAGTIDRILAWCEHEGNVEGAVIIGSQVRDDLVADDWSDLDLMLLLNDPDVLLNTSDWLDRFGNTVCAFNYITPLHFTDWDWWVKRGLFDDYRDLDFCLLPYSRLDEALSINQGIMAGGYRVLYDSSAGLLASKIEALTKAVEKDPPFTLSPQAIHNDLNDLLFHIIWAFKKIKRNELWVAVRCINHHIGSLLLRLIEYYNASVSHTSSSIMYDGRFLEKRTDEAIRSKLRYCVAKYDAQDAIDTLGCLIDLAQFLSGRLAEQNGYAWDAGQFDMIRKLYRDMKK